MNAVLFIWLIARFCYCVSQWGTEQPDIALPPPVVCLTTDIVNRSSFAGLCFNYNCVGLKANFANLTKPGYCPMRTTFLLLMLGGDIEINPGPCLRKTFSHVDTVKFQCHGQTGHCVAMGVISGTTHHVQKCAQKTMNTSRRRVSTGYVVNVTRITIQPVFSIPMNLRFQTNMNLCPNLVNLPTSPYYQ